MSDRPAAFAVPPLEKTVLVHCTPARAFQAFTAEIAQWWPLATHSVAQDRARGVAIEPFVGGRIFETDAAGGQSDWGRVLEWAPPQRLAFTWHPGRAAAEGQVVELSFTAEGAGTRIRLVHRGWESRGADAAQARDSYDRGWQAVLEGHFGDFCRHLA